MAEIRMTPKRKRWLQYYFGEAHLDATEAARMAGLKWPNSSGPRMKQILAQKIEAKEAELADKAEMKAVEVVQQLSRIAASENTRNQDRIRALEILAKIHGLTSEKLNVVLDRKDLIQAFNEQIKLASKELRPN